MQGRSRRVYKIGYNPRWNFGNLDVVHPKLSHNRFPMDGALVVGAGSHNLILDTRHQRQRLLALPTKARILCLDSL